MSTEGQRLPAARADGLLVEQVGDETVVYDLESKQVHCLSPLAATVFARCDGGETVAACAEAAGASEADVLAALDQLQERALLDRPALVVHGGVSRRSFVRAGAAVALAAPLISSIAAPTAAMAISGVPAGCSCDQNKDCASDHCCEKDGNQNCNKGCCVIGNNSCHVGAGGQCTSPLAGCSGVVCPPNTIKCCTPV